MLPWRKMEPEVIISMIRNIEKDIKNLGAVICTPGTTQPDQLGPGRSGKCRGDHSLKAAAEEG